MAQTVKDKQTSDSADRPKGRSKVRSVLNLRLLVETLIVAAIIGPGIYIWYYFQVRHAAAAMLERAQELVDKKDDAGAAQYYFQYLKLKPADADVQLLLAETFDRAAKGLGGKSRAVEYYYQALGVAPAEKQNKLRLRLAELLIELRRFTSAEEEAQGVLNHEPQDKEIVQANRLLALALYGQSRSGTLSGGRNLSTVGAAVEKAWKLNPADVDLSLTLAQIYRNQPDLVGSKQQSLTGQERNKLADEVMDQMVAAKPDDAEVLLARHLYKVRYPSKVENAANKEPASKEGKPTLAAVEDKGDLEKALQENPDDLAVVLQAAAEARFDAENLRRDGGPEKGVEAGLKKAQDLYEKAIKLDPLKRGGVFGFVRPLHRHGETQCSRRHSA